jgi:hypothetical protein
MVAAFSPSEAGRSTEVAHGLLGAIDTMAVEPGRWQKLNPSTIESVPEVPGIFEIGNLVRTVLFIGRADGSLRRRLGGLGAVPENVPASAGGYYVRWAIVEDEEGALAERQAVHRAQHDGSLPPGNGTRRRAPIRLVTQRAA